MFVAAVILERAAVTLERAAEWVASDTMPHEGQNILFAIVVGQLTPGWDAMTQVQKSSLLGEHLLTLPEFHESAVRAVQRSGSWMGFKPLDYVKCSIQIYPYGDVEGTVKGFVVDTDGSIDAATEMAGKVERNLPFPVKVVRFGEGPFVYCRIPHKGWSYLVTALLNAFKPLDIFQQHYGPVDVNSPYVVVRFQLLGAKKSNGEYDGAHMWLYSRTLSNRIYHQLVQVQR